MRTKAVLDNFNNGSSYLSKIVVSLILLPLLNCDRNSVLAQSQIVPDNTLGDESSQVTSGDADTQQIDGGAIRGSNLFHSFREFNVGEGKTVNFTNPDGIDNIFNRVTGNNISQILGDLGVSGDANLFLLNPKGIVFGERASLNVNGSFVATTANSILFNDGKQFTANLTSEQPLLTINVPIGLQFGNEPGAIVNKAQSPQKAFLNGQLNNDEKPAGLLVDSSQTLALIGGEIILEGGNLTASGGNIELGSVGNNSLVGLEATESNITFNYQAVENFLDITLTNREGFTLVIEGFQESEIPSTIDATTQETVGSINLQGKNINILNGSQLLTPTQGNQSGGNITVIAEEQLTVSGSNFFAFGKKLFPIPSLIISSTVGDGDAGNINITTQKLLVEDSAKISSSSTLSSELTTGRFITARGDAGDININASESIKLVTEGAINTDTVGDGSAGNINITTQNLLVENLAKISSSSIQFFDPTTGKFIIARGDAGDININASESIKLVTEGAINTDTVGDGSAGNINITTVDLIIDNEGLISVSSDNEESNIMASGDAGDINIQAQSLSLNNSSNISATTIQSDGGNINLQLTNNLELRNQSNISTSVGGNGDGGNININAEFVITSPQDNSDITAKAVDGMGGNIAIDASGIFGISIRENVAEGDSPLSEINASSDFGMDGTITLLNSDLQTDINNTDAEIQLVQNATNFTPNSCYVSRKNKYIQVGRGGIPLSSSNTLVSEHTWEDWRMVKEERASQINVNNPVQNQDISNQSKTTQVTPIQGWLVNQKGEIVLTANPIMITPHPPETKPHGC